MSKKKSKGEEEAGQAPAEESQVRPDEVADVKPKKKGRADEGARRWMGPRTLRLTRKRRPSQSRRWS